MPNRRDLEYWRLWRKERWPYDVRVYCFRLGNMRIEKEVGFDCREGTGNFNKMVESVRTELEFLLEKAERSDHAE